MVGGSCVLTQLPMACLGLITIALETSSIPTSMSSPSSTTLPSGVPYVDDVFDNAKQQLLRNSYSERPSDFPPYNMSPWNQSFPYNKSPWTLPAIALPISGDSAYAPSGLIGSLVREEGHIYSLAAAGNLLYTASDSKNIRVWKNQKEFSGIKSNRKHLRYKFGLRTVE